MADFDDGLVIGLAIGKKKFKGGSKEIEVEWDYPDYWPPLPDAGEGECIFLIRPSADRNKFKIILNLYQNTYSGTETIDWGDGNVEEIKLNINSSPIKLSHEYADSYIGQYLFIKLQTAFFYRTDGDVTHRCQTSVSCDSDTSGCTYALAASVGRSLCCYASYSSFNPMYVRFCMDDLNELSASNTYNDNSAYPYTGYYRALFQQFTGSYTRRIDFTGNPTVFGTAYNSGMPYLTTLTGVDSVTKFNEYISNGQPFRNCSALKKISFPSVTELPENSFKYAYSLREAFLPKCKKIGQGCFSGCDILQRVTVAKGCEIAPSAFQGNYHYVEIAEV